MCGRSVDEWQAVLDCYRRAPALGTDEILKITKNALENLEVSMETALVRIEEEHVQMHDLQEEMHIETARQDVREGVNIVSRIYLYKCIYVAKKQMTEWMFLIVSLMLEIFSAICDQLSSPRKPLYALFGVGLAIMALATCIWEFIHKGRRGNVQFGKCGILLWWFYCPSSGTFFGTFPEICGLIYAITQWASSMVQFVCVLRHKDNPFKVNILPVFFLLCLANYPIEIESRVQDMHDLLGIGDPDVRMVGILGDGGMGKTTIAKAVYNSVAHKFEGCCFLENVRESSKTSEGLLQLQHNLLRTILGDIRLGVNGIVGRIRVMKNMMSRKRVLVVLDDVSQNNELEKLVGEFNWFASGSRIIITTRFEHVLVNYRVDLAYKVKKLEFGEALEVFSSNAFPRSRLPDDPDYQKLATSFLDYARGNPLALTAMALLHFDVCATHEFSSRKAQNRRTNIRATKKLSRINRRAKATSAKWTFLLIALCLEILLLAFDQVSSARNPQYACILELIYKGKKERVELRRWRTLWWFYYPRPQRRLFGDILDIFGLLLVPFLNVFAPQFSTFTSFGIIKILSKPPFCLPYSLYVWVLQD
ncbi:unnamed protein product [Prunus brigantina]